jgi:hypothetical protein
MAYRLTPAERRALAIARANRDNPLINYYQDNQIVQEQTDRIQPQESNANALVRGVHTVGDIAGNVLTGALKGLEGIYDFGAGIVGGIGGIFDDDFRDRVKEHIATDYVGNSVGNFLQDLTDQSYLKEGGFIENVAGGVGQMLPALAAAGITGGGSLVSLGTLGVSAAGGGTEEAFNDGAGYYQGLGYGAVRGATEIATEKLLGGADKLITGRGLFEGVKIAKQGLGRVVSEAINEGAEEVASELVNPLTRSIYKGTDAFKEYGDADYWKGVAEAGLVGGATSVAFGQTVGRMTGTSGKKGDINESLTEIKQANEKLSNLQAENNLTQDKRTKVNEIIKGNWANIERTLQSVNADKRQALIKQFNLENEVNEDGTIKDTFKQSLTAEMPENDYYNQSVSLQGNAEKTNKDLGTIKQGMANNLIDEANGIDEQKANEMVGDVSLFKGELTDTQKQNRSKFMKALNVLNKKGNAKLTFAILNPNEYFSANVTDGTLYIGADSFKTDQWAKDLVHEVTHLEEGTEEYNKLVKELLSDDILVDDGNGGKVSLYQKAAQSLVGQYIKDADEINSIIDKINKKYELNKQEQEVFELFASELTARSSELYLGSEEFIDRIIASDTSLAKKIFDKIFNTKQALQKVDKNNAEVKRLLKAEKLWLDASKRIGNVQLAKYIQSKEKELKEKLQEGVENEGQTQYNRKGFQKVRKYKTVTQQERSFIFRNLVKLFFGYDNVIANDIAIENGDKVYIVDSGKENGKTDFQVVEAYIITNKQLREEFIRRTNDESVSKGHISDGLSSKFGDKYDNDRGSDTRHKLGQELSIDNEQSQNNEAGISQGNADRGNLNKSQFNLKISNETVTGEAEAIKAENEYLEKKKKEKNDKYSRFNLKEINPISNEEITALKNHFGTTGNFKVAGYMLQDGKLLDFSGKHWGDTTSRSRQVDHRDVGEVLERGNNGVDDMIDMIGNGNIRLMPEIGGINLAIYPTEKQRQVLSTYINYMLSTEGQVVIDYDEVGGDTVYTRTYGKSATSRQILADIRNYFNGGRPSSLMEFHTQFNLKSNPQISLSNGEIRKLVANYTRAKVYSRNETEISINNLIEELGELFTTEKISLKGKSKEEAIQMLWQGLNSVDSQDRQAFAEKVAEYIIKNSIVESTYKDADYDYYADVYNVLHSYVQKFNLDHIKTEIEHKYGKAEAKSIIARWQSKDGKGMSVDGYAEEINELGFRIDETKEADIFFAINDAYEKSLEKLKKEANTSFNQFLNDSEAIAIKDGLTKEILDLFKTTGQISDKTKQRNAVSKLINNIVKKYNDKARRWRNKYKLLKETERATRTLVKKINKIAEFKEGVFWNATQYKTDAFKGSIEKLTKLIHNGNLNQSATRDILKSFLEWYKKENPMLEGYYDESIAKAIDDLANNRKPLTDEEANLLEYLENKSGLTDINEIVKWYTLDNLHKKYDNFTKDWLKELASPKVFNLAEIKAMINFIDHVNHIAKDYKKVYRNGKLVDAQPLAEEYIKIIKKNAPVKVGWLQKFWRWYLKAFGDPMAYARYVDRYNGNGFYTEMLEKFRKASTDAAVMEMEFRKELDEFLDKHSKWQKNLKDRTVEYSGHEIPMVNAIALYMTLNREQALLGLAESGFVYKDKDGNKKDVRGFATGQTKTMTMDELIELAQNEQAKIKKGFSEIELEYIAIVEKIFNEQCKKAKEDADMKMRGYTNIIDGYYYPIMREGIADSVDTSTMFEVQNRVSNASFNKDTIKGAKQKLFIDNALTLADRHIKGISMYANLGAVVNEYDMLMNLDISGNPNNAVSIKAAGKDVIYQDANAYFKQMVSDIQGIRDADTIFTKGLRAIRSNYVRFQLGANPKTLVTQLSSLFASTSILDYGSIVQGFGISGKDVNKYSPLAMLRNYDQSAYKAEGVLDKTGGIGDFLMKPIGKVDRFVITKLFGACQVQVEKNGGAKVGTDANKIEAGKLLEQVIYETQQNSLATERSAAMRSKNELVKGLVMFSSDAMKVAGRFIDSVGHYVTLKARLKHTTVQTEIDAINKELKDAKKQLGKSTGALVTTSIFMALVAQAFRYLFAKDDEDDNVAVNMTVDAVGNLLGGLPLFKDAYSFLADGYDLDMYAYSTINDFLSSVGKLMDIKWTDSRSITSAIKDLSFSLGQLSGIPSRNIYNTLYGLIKRFSPETAYKFDNMLYNQSYRADLEKAIENDDDDMISVIAGLMLDENIGGLDDAEARSAMTDLIGKGYDILPRSVGDTITYDDETYELTNRQKNQFKKVYNASNEAVANMVKLAQFKEASDDVKAKAIKYVYNVYYNLALQDFLGVSIENKNILFAEAIDIEKLALISASANSIKADTDKNGKQISGSRKKKIQEYVNSLKMKAVEKYMVMGYLGYSNIYGENQVKAYINRLKLSKDEKSLLLGYSGYKVA